MIGRRPDSGSVAGSVTQGRADIKGPQPEDFAGETLGRAALIAGDAVGEGNRAGYAALLTDEGIKMAHECMHVYAYGYTQTHSHIYEYMYISISICLYMYICIISVLCLTLFRYYLT